VSRALIVGGDSDENLGDAAILAALCHCLSRTSPGVEITIAGGRRLAASQHAPQGTQLPGVVRRIPRGWRGIRESAWHAPRQDLIIVGGGGLLQDDDSRVKMPFWASRLLGLRLLNEHIVGHSLGAGPLFHAASRTFARLACSTLRSISVRDEFARSWLSGCTSSPVDVVPDPAFMLPAAHPLIGLEVIRASGLALDRPIIGVALRRWFHPRGGFIPHRLRAGFDADAGGAERESLLDQLTAAIRHVAGRLDASVLFMPTYNVAHEADYEICWELRSRLGNTPAALTFINDPAMYKSVVGHLSLMISARMHPLIFAACMGVPMVGLAYNGKFAALFDLLELPRRLIWLDDFLAADQRERLESLALRACADNTDVAARAAELADVVEWRTAALFDEARTH
jgi:polysaccharide pyruvyl transferase WcaK-like protein